MRKINLLFLLAAFLPSCINQPCYFRPQVPIPEEWRTDVGELGEMVNIRWWEDFNDPALDELIYIALHNNMDFKIAAARVYEYYAQFGSVYAGLFPQIGGVVNADRQRSSLLAFPTILPSAQPGNRTSTFFEMYFNISWELDFWGRLRNAAAAAYHDFLAQVEMRKGVALTLVQSVARAYIVLRQYDMQLAFAKKTVQSRQEYLELAILRFKEGFTSELEVKQAQSEVEDAKIQVKILEIQIPQQENLLSVLIGENPGPIARGDSLDTMAQPREVPAGLPSILLEQRPDILQAEENIYAASARIAAAKAEFFPKINLSGFLGASSPQLKNLLNSKAQEWEYGGQLVQTVFDAGRLEALLDRAMGVELENVFTYILTVQRAFRDVDNALVALEKNRELLNIQKEQVQVLSDYLSLATLRYQEGETDYLNVLDAQRSLFNSQLNLAAAYANTFLSLIDLYSALGGGWVEDADAEALSCPCNSLFHEGLPDDFIILDELPPLLMDSGGTGIID